MQTSMKISAAVALQQRFSDCVPFGGDDNWADHEIAGCVFKDAGAWPTIRKAVETDGERDGREYSSGLPGLGEHEGGLPLLCQ